METLIGIVHPGDMGAVIGGELRHAGHAVAWASEGRSTETAERAATHGLVDHKTIESLAIQANIIVSVCPPAFAVDVARRLVETGFRGIYVDANAVAPATAREIATVLDAAGATFVDGGIVGPPPRAAGTTRLFLSGPAWPTATVADHFANTAVNTVIVSETPGDASAVKMAYAAWTKGSTALLLATRAYAHRAGDEVEAALLAEWERSQPGLAQQAELRRTGSAPKAWRWIAEMREIANAFDEHGQPRGFHDAAAEVFDNFDDV